MKKQWKINKSNEMITENNGANNHRLDYAFHKLDPHALYVLAGVVFNGEKDHGSDNWRKDTPENHVNHAIAHLYAWLAGDKTEDHLGHAFCRTMFAVAIDGAEDVQPEKPVQKNIGTLRITKRMLCHCCEKIVLPGDLGWVDTHDYLYCSKACAEQGHAQNN